MKEFLASWVPIVSPLGAFIIALLTLFNVLIARRSLKLMELKEVRWQPGLELYHSDSYMKKFPKRNLRLYAVALRVSNKSDADNSIKELTLFIRFNHGGNLSTNLAIPQVTDTQNDIVTLSGRKPNEIIPGSLFLKARGVHSAWALFRVEDALLRGTTTEVCELRVVDANDTQTSLPIMILRQESNESE